MDDPIAKARALINSWLGQKQALTQPRGDAVNTKFGQIPFKGPVTATPPPIASFQGYQQAQERGGFAPPPNQFDFGQAGEMISSAAGAIKGMFTPDPTPGPKMWREPTNEVLRFNDEGQIFDNPAPTATPYPSATPLPTATSSPTPSIDGWSSKYQPVWESELTKKGIEDKTIIKLIVQSENGKEDPGHVNDNGDGTVDVGLGQINVSKSNTAEIERLKNPEYNIQKATDIWNARLKNLEDPVLALASYNLGAGGAVLNPEKALNRSKQLYAHSGIPLPETEFTQNPLAFVRARMDKYKKLGLFKSR